MQPVSFKLDLSFLHTASEALSGWRDASSDAFSAMTSSTASWGFKGREKKPWEEVGLSRASPERRPRSPSGDDGVATCSFYFPPNFSIAWSAQDGRRGLSDDTKKTAPFPLVLRPCLLNQPEFFSREEATRQEAASAKPAGGKGVVGPFKKYVFKTFTVAPTSLVLSFKVGALPFAAFASDGALRRSALRLYSLEDARFDVEGLTLSARQTQALLREQLQKASTKGASLLKGIHQELDALTPPSLSAAQVSCLLAEFYKTQLTSHLSRVVASVDVLGERPGDEGRSLGWLFAGLN